MNQPDYVFCPRCSKPLDAQSRFGKLRLGCPSCGWILFQDPKVAAAVLIRDRNSVLLVRRMNEPFRGRWTLPAGFIDAGEDPRLAAERECLEETGLEVRAVDIVDVIAGREHERGADFVLVFAAHVLGGELRAGDDADRVQWFDAASLPPLAFRATEKILLPLGKNRSEGP